MGCVIHRSKQEVTEVVALSSKGGKIGGVSIHNKDNPGNSPQMILIWILSGVSQRLTFMIIGYTYIFFCIFFLRDQHGRHAYIL